MTYSSNRTRGQWAAHGRYLARESATRSKSGHGSAFGPAGNIDDVITKLSGWQRSGDPRLFKMIVSPEFGEPADLEKLTRDLLAWMEFDLHTKLEWVGTAHYNTEHPHVHVALRGITKDKKPLFFERAYLRHRIREYAEDLVTGQTGYRTVLDSQEAQRRCTLLDRMLTQGNAASGATTGQPGSIIIDLEKLRKMGQAESSGTQGHDARLPIRVTNPKTLDQPLEGRVMAHGEDETTSRTYMLLEGTDHAIHFIYQTPEMEEACQRGKLLPNAFVRLKALGQRQSTLEILDFGDAEKLLQDKSYLRNKVRMLLKSGIIPVENGWAGWVGRYDAALARIGRDFGEEKQIVKTNAVSFVPSRGR